MANEELYEDTRSWYQSRAVWGALVAIGAGVAAALGYDVSEAAQAELLTAVMSIVGGGLALYGRIKATKKLGK